jgi:uncharacterized protein (TIGR03435 family)
MPVRPIITFAYLNRGLPAHWRPGLAGVDRYDINAKMEETRCDFQPSRPTTPNPCSCAAHLLRIASSWKVHRETREMDIYALVLAARGNPARPEPRRRTARAAARAAEAKSRQRQPPACPLCGIQGSTGRLRICRTCLVRVRTEAFSGPAGRMVIEPHGLTRQLGFRY